MLPQSTVATALIFNWVSSLAPWSVAACGRLQLDAACWATSVALLQVVDNLPHEQWQ